MSVQEISLLITATIGAVASAIVAVMNGVNTRRKLDVIHRETNGNLKELKRELASVRSQLRKEREG